MTRKQRNIDIFLILIAIISLALAAKIMLRTPTFHLPAWFITMMYAGSLLIVAFALGYLFSVLLEVRIRIITLSAIIISVVSLLYFFDQYKPTYEIIVPEKFSGEVKLFRSILAKDQLVLDKFGVGYITDKSYRRGFIPVIYQNKLDITKDCENIMHGSLAYAGTDGATFGPYEYIGFTVPGNSGDTIWNDLNRVLQLKAIDTSIIRK